jgi:subfamily B ATP-binding cassette protein MsbA
MIAGSIGSFTGLYSQFQEALGASSRIFELLDTTSELLEPAVPIQVGSTQSGQPERIEGRVRFENVLFRYGDRGDANILSGISLEAEPGEVIALVGPSGAGKSTLVALIPRFYDVTDGRILIDGHDVRDIKLEALRSHIGIVPQETQLFSGTILENIRYGKPDASESEVLDAARAANAHEFISAFPDGYNTVVGERGVKLSGGQRQRVAIARAILKNPRILILDEATSALDSESELLVQEALERLMQRRTTFVIAHRLSTVRNADRIVVLEAGRVQSVGTHDELMLRGGLYRDLYELQFRDNNTVTV